MLNLNNKNLGGGPKGAAFAGSIQEVEAANLRWAGVSGASEGAITAAFIAVGYNGKEYERIMKEVDFLKLMDLFPLERLKYEVKMYSLLKSPDAVSRVLSESTNFIDDLPPKQGVMKSVEQGLLSFGFSFI